MEDDEAPGSLQGADHGQVDDQAVRRIVESARAVEASAAEVAAPGSAEPLQDALQDATPDERSAAAKELADDRAAYSAMHEALRALGIEPDEQ